MHLRIVLPVLGAAFLFVAIGPVQAKGLSKYALGHADEISQNRPNSDNPKLDRFTKSNEASSASTDSEVVLQYSAMHFKGNTIFSTEELKGFSADYIDQPISVSDLRSLANKVTQAYLEKGYFLSHASISLNQPRQGTLIIKMEEGFVSKVQYGDVGPIDVTSIMNEVQKEIPVTKKTFDLAISRLRHIDGFIIKNVVQKEDPEIIGGHILTIDTEFQKIRTTFFLTNKGSREGEDLKGLVALQVNSGLRIGDSFRLSYLTKPKAIDELTYISARYEAPTAWRNSRAYVSYTKSQTEPKTALIGRNLYGELNRGSAGLKIPLIFDPKMRAWADLSIESSDVTEFEDGALLYRDKIRMAKARLGFLKRHKNNNRSTAILEFTQGLDVFGATQNQDTAVSRPGADGIFTKIYTELTHQQFLADNVSVKVGFSGQYANDDLLFSEEFSIGGGQYGRGYDFGEVLGDSGSGAFAELILHGSKLGPINRWEGYGFIDSGAIWNHGEETPADGVWLSSAGLGVRYFFGNWGNLAYEAAMPLSDAPYTEDDEDIRHRFDLSVSY